LIEGPDPAAAFEALFDRNRWPAAWRNGVFPFHHFHTNAHEVLGVYSGEVTVQFGGDSGVVVTARPGDVIVLPAGTGHKKVSSRGALGIVGAYPAGQHPDMRTPLLSSARRSVEAVAGVPLPECDPVHGPADRCSHTGSLEDTAPGGSPDQERSSAVEHRLDAPARNCFTSAPWSRSFWSA
jgi:uncharacterized protein YjlB